MALNALIVLFATIGLASCGDSSNGNPVSPTTSPAPRVLQQNTFTLAAPSDDVYYFGLTTINEGATGRWEATVDWRDEANTLWMWVAEGVCSVDQFASPECPFDATCPCRFAIRSETATPKPRVLTIPGAAGGTRTLIIMNLGPREEAGQYRVTLTPSNGAIGSGLHAVAPAASAGSGVSTARKTWPSQR